MSYKTTINLSEVQTQLDKTSTLLGGQKVIDPQEQQLQAIISQLLDHWILEFEDQYFSILRGEQDGTQIPNNTTKQSSSISSSLNRRTSQ